eukprot:CAMPEP_0198464522 /NCGR_PEP_ID=MMETSP1456-20131121/2659_1 /TAXON_ID=1461544 ORGANISM="Unidentified sp., Strain RCC1871" /NCGR_SAMPLE_ID=MMETSP1456 /ASSEMBLY_ACC=CAM_ASM_001119 /LENGTH=83 /DNA_ID=CAMNT_0044190235 /DNA_START=24 /DNA_END=271 /DNA_ORIENTATION=+
MSKVRNRPLHLASPRLPEDDPSSAVGALLEPALAPLPPPDGTPSILSLSPGDWPSRRALFFALPSGSSFADIRSSHGALPQGG